MALALGAAMAVAGCSNDADTPSTSGAPTTSLAPSSSASAAPLTVVPPDSSGAPSASGSAVSMPSASGPVVSVHTDPPAASQSAGVPGGTPAVTAPGTTATTWDAVGRETTLHCQVAFPLQPKYTADNVELTLICDGLPGSFKYVIADYPDTSLAVTPDTGYFNITGVVQKFDTVDGNKVVRMKASKIVLAGQ